MNYQKVYDSIVSHALVRNTHKGGSVVVESHHIVPKHCGGPDTKNNLVNLTLREHYVCHLLLAKMYKNTPYYAGMCRAVVAMNQRGGVRSRAYEAIRSVHVKNLRSQVISKEQKQAISLANRGNKHRAGHKNSTEHIEILRQSRLGSKHSTETKQNWSIIRKGKIPPNKGMIKELSPLYQVKKPTVICPHCDKVGGAPAMKRFHFENCKTKEKY